MNHKRIPLFWNALINNVLVEWAGWVFSATRANLAGDSDTIDAATSCIGVREWVTERRTNLFLH